MWDDPMTKKIEQVQLIKSVVATVSGVVDVPSQVQGVTDAMVRKIRELYEEEAG
jgi:hypothetical protein